MFEMHVYSSNCLLINTCCLDKINEKNVPCFVKCNDYGRTLISPAASFSVPAQYFVKLLTGKLEFYPRN